MPYEMLIRKYHEQWEGEPDFIVRAPGRVNLIGEHTDYNDGYVFPAAIDYEVSIAGTAREDREVHAYSLTFEQHDVFSLDRLEKAVTARWSNYLRGVAQILEKTGHQLNGMNVVVAGTVPLGSGLSSSAAIEVASSLAYEAANGFDLNPVDRALNCQRAEREFVGVQCGIMDQFISALGAKDHALLIDTRTLAYERIPLPSDGVKLVIGNTNKKRGLVDSEYNTRREECGKAVATLATVLPGIKKLRDVTAKQLAAHSGVMDPTVLRRARHVVTEDERVLKSVEALRAGDLVTFGKLMDESHDSLRDDYEVSCNELDVMVHEARKVAGVYGSRMTGAGFGGCTVSLVKEDCVDTFQEAVGEAYTRETGLTPAFYVCHACDGASRIR